MSFQGFYLRRIFLSLLPDEVVVLQAGMVAYLGAILAGSLDREAEWPNANVLRSGLMMVLLVVRVE